MQSDVQKDKSTPTYWNQYYAERRVGGVPSQFAAFILSEFAERSRFVDFGCGNGRDAFFFGTHDKKVMGVDGSSSAISGCTRQAELAGLNNMSFETVDFSSDQDCEAFLARNGDDWKGAVLYARFFIHAIDASEEERFLRLCCELVGDTGAICLEFRTHRDEHQEKVTASHYRRFVRPVEFIRTLQDLGLHVDYFCEGFGMAKYKADDAHVARFVVTKPC